MRIFPIRTRTPRRIAAIMILAVSAILCPAPARAAEHITLTNGFELNCLRHESLGDSGRVRLYTASTNPAEPTNYIEVNASAIQRVEPLADMPPVVLAPVVVQTSTSPATPRLQAANPDIHAMLSQAGARHNIDVDLLASLVNAESGGHTAAVSRAGARGLMQLMPATAASLGVADAFRPEQNIAGGTTYLDQLLTRYHDDVALALAAYNAGPGAVDRYHGIPPYRETRAYVARIINEFNRRKRLALQTASLHP